MQDANKRIFLELSVQDDHFEFSSSIAAALSAAENEYQDIVERIEESTETIQRLTPECDKQDYILSASCGVLCSIIDIFLVGKPGQSPIGDITDKWFEDRTKDFARLCGWKDKENGRSSAIAYLEKKFQVPYDQRGAGDAGKSVFDLTPQNHHFKSLGHNPTLMGLFFSILDQFATPNQSHFVSLSDLIALDDADNSFVLRGKDIPSKLFCAFVNWFGHLISDMSGSSGSKGRGMGIPSPFWCWTNDIIAIKRRLNIPALKFDNSLNELALGIYTNGYDIRFQTAQMIPVFLNETVVRFIYSVRRLVRYYSVVDKEERTSKRLWKECEPFSNATVKRMLTVAHGTFCLIDTGDALVSGLTKGDVVRGVLEFTMRLNIIGVGRFAISLYGEADRIGRKTKEQEYIYNLTREKYIIEDYIKGLKYLSEIYDDIELLTFVEDFKSSDMYKTAFVKSVELAKKRNVSDEKILKSKADIDSYFRGNK